MTDNIQLYGHDDTSGIVSVKMIQDDPDAQQCYVMVWRRENGELKSETRRLYPFFYLDDIKHLHGFPSEKYLFKRLDGSGHYRIMVVLKSWRLMWAAVKHVKEKLKWKESGYPEQMYIVTNPEQQFLMQTGMTYFKNMEASELHRMQFDIEAYNRRGFPNAKRKDNPIFIIGINDNRGYRRLLHTAPEGINVEHGERFSSEADLLYRFREIVKEVDPDVFVGHNIFGFDLPYIHERFRLHGIPFDLSRDGSEPDTYDTHIRFAERDVDYTSYTFAGRNVIDTYFMVMGYDVIKRDMPGYSLKVAARHFGFAPDDREYIAGDKIAQTWDEDPQRVLDYADDDVVETDLLYGHLGGSVFETAKMIPMPYDRVARAGTAGKIESLMVREYVRLKYALPGRDKGYPEVAEVDEKNMEVGGYTDVFKVGIYDNVVYADVASLYPSIMLRYGIEPMGDDLKLFRGLLQNLTDLRFATKAEMTVWEEKVDELKKQLESDPGNEALKKELAHAKHMQQSKDNQQGSYKILINSFFGALGFKFFIFNDFKEADRVTVTGQDLLNQIMRNIRKDGGTVIEVDTDGVLAIPPPFVYTKGDEADRQAKIEYCANDKLSEREAIDDVSYVKSLTSRMPDGIEIDFDGRAETMMSYKKKNYALREIKNDGTRKVKIKGGSLISRLVADYRLSFVEEVIHAILDRDTAKIHEIYKRYWVKVAGSQWTPEEFCSTATIKDPIETYLKKIELGPGNGGRNRAAAYELAIQRAEETGVPAQVGDRISYYTKQTYKENGKKVARSTVRVFECAEFAENWDPENPDEHTDWYLHKLKESAQKFQMFFTEHDWRLLFSETDEPGVDYSKIRIMNKDVKKTPIKVIVAGTRDVEDLFWVKRAIAGAKFLRKIDDDVNPGNFVIGEIVSGTARGVDQLGEIWAEENEIPVAKFPADWENIDHPKAVVKKDRNGREYNAIAGHLRNEQMADYADALIAIWDGKSAGTRNMINTAKKKGLMVHVSKIKPTQERDPK